jgi:hypothetical protein
MGIIGVYTSLFFGCKLTFGKKKSLAQTEVPGASATSNGSIPSIESPEFDKWVSTPGNVDKLFA